VTGPPEEIRVLRSVLEAMSEELELRAVVQRVAEVVTGVAGSDVCFVHLLDEQTGGLVLAGGTPPFDELSGSIRLALGEGVAGWVALHREPAVVPDKWSDPRYRYIPALRGEDFTSLVSVPMLQRDGRVVGVLNVHSRLPRSYSDADVALLCDVASLLAGTVENARLYHKLAEREAALERFAAATLDAEEAERRRVAGDIHDGISQRLVSLWYRLEAARAALEDDLAEAAAELEAARGLAAEALDEARRAIRGLRPGVLDDLGLAASLESLARDAPLDVAVEVEPLALDAHAETALYRIAQEAMQNAVKHARASRLELRLARHEDEAVLTVTDDGCGFDPAAAPSDTRYGLEGMRERAELAGGRLSLRSHPDRGTVVEARVPLERSTG
jgi:two-component system NarL family sensor kinase